MRLIIRIATALVLTVAVLLGLVLLLPGERSRSWRPIRLRGRPGASWRSAARRALPSGPPWVSKRMR